MRNYKLYVHISPNEKRYYGITGQKVKYRWRNGKGYGENDYFTNAINKYGWNNFKHIVLFDNLTKEEAELLEQMYIALYDTTNREKGYNMTFGGEGSNGLKHTEEWKQEHSEKMSGSNNPRARKVVCLNTREEFNTAVEGGNKYNANITNIYACCNGSKKHKSSGVFNGKKLVWRYYEDYILMTEEEINKGIEEAHIVFTEDTIQRMSESRQGKKHSNAHIYKVINSNGEVVGVYCINEICNKNSKGFLDIGMTSFNKYIRPFGNIDISRIQGNYSASKKVREKLQYYDGWQFINIDKDELDEAM